MKRTSYRPVSSLRTDGGTDLFIVQEGSKGGSTVIPCTTAFTAQSNGLAERFHGNSLAVLQAILRQSCLPIRFSNYMILYAVDCKFLLLHSTTGEVPIKAVQRHRSVELEYIRLCRFGMLYHPVTDRIKTFNPRLCEYVCLE